MYALTIRSKYNSGDLVASTLRLKYQREEALLLDLCHRVVADLPEQPPVSPCQSISPQLLSDLRLLVSQAPPRRFSPTKQTYTSDQIKITWRLSDRL